MNENEVEPTRVVTIAPEESILQAKAKMTSYDIRHLPVVDDEGRLVGILSDRDLRSVMPFGMKQNSDVEHLRHKLSAVEVTEVMTHDPYTISASDTLQDALLQFTRFNVGAFPVVDADRRVVAIISYRDMLRMFIQFLGVEQPGSFLAVTIDDSRRQVEDLVGRLSRENISIASMLVIPVWGQNRSALYLYLLTKNIQRVRKLVSRMTGYTLIEPLQWFLRRFRPGNSEFGKTD